MKSLVCFGMAALTGLALGGNLKWIGAFGGSWTGEGNWQDESGSPANWVDGSTAVFGDLGGDSIAVSGTVAPAGLVFEGSTTPTISGGTIAFPANMPITLNDNGATISSALTIQDGFVANFEHPCEWTGLLPANEGTGTYDQYGGKTITLWKNRTLADLTFESGNIVIWDMKPLFAKAYHPKWANGKVTVQFQYETNKDAEGVYCVYVEFAQVGADITACVVRARTRRFETTGRRIEVGDDWDTLQYSGGSAKIHDEIVVKNGGIGIRDIVAFPSGALALNGKWTMAGNCVVSNGTLRFDGGQHSFSAGRFEGNGALVVTNTSANSYTFEVASAFVNNLSGALLVDGAMFRVNGNSGKGTAACGPGCDIRVVNGGVLYSYRWAHGSFGGENVGTTLYVGPNSKYIASVALRNLSYVKTVVDGGTLEFTNEGSYGAGQTPVSDLTLRNGAQVIDSGTSISGIILGNCVSKPRLTVDGTNEVTVAARMRIEKDNTIAESVRWDPSVQYATVDTKQNLRMTGGFMTAPVADKGWDGLRLRKRGVAKLILDYSQDDFPAGSQQENKIEVCVDEGILEIRKSNAIVSTQPLSLYGTGKAAFAADTETVVKTLTVGGTNEMSFVEGATFACAGLSLKNGARLNLTGAVGDKTVRIGTSKCLTDGELAKIRIDNHAVLQDENGYLEKSGFVVLIK